ncbi:TIR domain-containing protein, partial [Frankia tisae]|uniref:TIR domain-containing protein n=1 Tax=Frankia tisae TaxID=2950104 RepID=UPI0021C19DF2
MWIAWQLMEAGYRPRLQAWHSVPGRNFVEWIQQELAAASHIVAVLSPDYLTSPWCKAELRSALAHAVEGRKILVPVRIAPGDSPELMRQIGRITLVDLSADYARRALLDGLHAADSGEKVPPAVAPPFPGVPGGGDVPPPFPGPDREALTTRLLGLVEEACQLRHPDATIRRPTAGSPFPYLEAAGMRDRERQRWPIGVSIDSPNMTTMKVFHETVIREIYLPADDSVDSELVHLGAPAAEEVLKQARRHRIKVRSLAEFEGRWDPRRYLKRQAERLAKDPVYPPGLYVPQRFSLGGDGLGGLGGGQGDKRTVQGDVFTAMLDWLDVEDSRFLLVLGDFGHGKSFLLRELARRLPEELPQVSPMLVELRTLEKTHTIDELLAVHLTKDGEHGVDVRAVRRMVEQGKVALLFDGFDELALRVTYDRAAEHLKTVLDAVNGRAKVVLTSRTQHFLTDSQHRTELGDQAQRGAGSREVHLEDFDAKQIREFLVRLFRQQVAAQEASSESGQTDIAGQQEEAERRASVRLDLIRSIQDLLGLSANPRMLGFIAELDERELLDARTGDGITSADLYAKLLTRWLDHEVSRRQPTSGAHQTLDAGQLRQAVDALAVDLWKESRDTLGLDSLSDSVRTTFTDLESLKLDPKQATFIVGSGSMLVRTDDATFGFVHRSVLEYLVAAQAAGQLAAATSGPAPSLLGYQEMSDLMVDFLHGIAGRADLEQWARATLEEHPGPGTSAGTDGGTARSNALRVARRMKLRLHGTQLAGQDLRGHDLTGQNLRFANLTGANLSGIRLYEADLTGATLTGADLTGALLVRPTLTGATLTGSTWDAAALLAPTLDPDATTSPELAAAAITGRDPADLMLLPAAAAITCVAAAPGLLAVGWGRSIALLDSTTLRPLRILTGHTDWVSSVAFAPDGTTLASGSDDQTIRLWDTTTGRQLHKLTGHTSTVSSVAFAPDGTTLASGSNDQTIRLWDTTTGRQLHKLTGHTDWVRSVAFAPDGTTLASGSNDQTIRLWDTTTGRQLHKLTGHTNWVSSVAFAPDGTTLASGSNDQTIR